MSLNAPIFTWHPSYEPVLKRETRFIEARFGDGYKQRGRDGINSIRRKWSLQWVNEDREIAEEIDNFLTARGAVESFYFFDTTDHSGLYTCDTWDKRDTGPGLCTVTAEFEESFDVPNEFWWAEELGWNNYIEMMQAAAIAVNTENDS